MSARSHFSVHTGDPNDQSHYCSTCGEQVNVGFRHCDGEQLLRLHRESYDTLFKDLNRWFDEVIPHEAKDDITKFKEESREFLENPTAEEAADALMCLVHFCHLSGFDLKAAIQAKFEKNKGRVWQRQADGTWHHVKPTTAQAPVLHAHRCNVCGRTWQCGGNCNLIAEMRCLACGATHKDQTNAPDGIDFRHQDTEKGTPSRG